MVATAAQLAANRANAQRSTGPRTPEGKAASSRNALTHGAYASDDTILATASDAYLEDFRAHFQPANPLEEHLVEHLAALASRRKRLQLALDALLELNERHALIEHLHERYGINTPNARIPGQPAWQAAMRRYDGNTYVDTRFPEPVSDPALDPDAILCSLTYTLSGPRAAALFRHEAAVDRRFSATLKDLTVLQAQHRAAALTAPPTTPPFEPRLQRALDHHLRETRTAPISPSTDSEPLSCSVPPSDAESAPAYPNSQAALPVPNPPALDQAAAPTVDHAAALPDVQIEANSPSAQNEASLPIVQIEANAIDGLPPTGQSNTLQNLLLRFPTPPSGLYSALLEGLLPPIPNPKS
jgi:hypothetical protein